MELTAAAINSMATAANESGEHNGERRAVRSRRQLLVVCFLVVCSFLLLLAQSIMTWIEKMSKNDKLWRQAEEMLNAYFRAKQNYTECCDYDY